jgi:hypothetical protein
MLVVPVVAFAGTVAVLVLFVSRRYGPHWALLAGAGLILPTTISRWSVTVMTEAPAMFVTTAILLVLPLSRATGRRQLWWYLWCNSRTAPSASATTSRPTRRCCWPRPCCCAG